MVESYQLLDLYELADQALLVLNSNYPEHESLDEKGNFKKSRSIKNRDRGWLKIISLCLLG